MREPTQQLRMLGTGGEVSDIMFLNIMSYQISGGKLASFTGHSHHQYVFARLQAWEVRLVTCSTISVIDS